MDIEVSVHATRGFAIKVRTLHGGKEIGSRRLKHGQLITTTSAGADHQSQAESFQLHPDAVGIIHDSIIFSVLRSDTCTCGTSLSLQAKKKLVSNLVKNGSPSTGNSANTPSIVAGHDLLFLSYEDDQGSADIVDENDLLEAIANAVAENKSIDIMAEVGSIINLIVAADDAGGENASGEREESDDGAAERTITLTISQLRDIVSEMVQEEVGRLKDDVVSRAGKKCPGLP